MTYEQKGNTTMVSIMDDGCYAKSLEKSDTPEEDYFVLNHIITRIKNKFSRRLPANVDITIDDKNILVSGPLKNYVPMKWFITEVLLAYFDHS